MLLLGNTGERLGDVVSEGMPDIEGVVNNMMSCMKLFTDLVMRLSKTLPVLTVSSPVGEEKTGFTGPDMVEAKYQDIRKI